MSNASAPSPAPLYEVDSTTVLTHLQAIEEARTPSELQAAERALDAFLSRVNNVKRQAKKRIRTRKKEVDALPSQLEQDIITMCNLITECKYSMQHAQQDLDDLIARHVDTEKAKKLATSTKRKAWNAIDKRCMQANVNPATDPIPSGVTFRQMQPLYNRLFGTSKPKYRPLRKRSKTRRANNNVAPGQDGDDDDAEGAFAEGTVGDADDMCIICMESTSRGVATTTCANGHCFCNTCIVTWLNGKTEKQCPTCRVDISDVYAVAVALSAAK